MAQVITPEEFGYALDSIFRGIMTHVAAPKSFSNAKMARSYKYNPDLPCVGNSVDEIETLELANIMLGGRSSTAEDLLKKSKSSD